MGGPAADAHGPWHRRCKLAGRSRPCPAQSRCVSHQEHMRRRRCAHKLDVQDDAGGADGDGDDVIEVVLDVLHGDLGRGPLRLRLWARGGGATAAATAVVPGGGGAPHEHAYVDSRPGAGAALGGVAGDPVGGVFELDDISAAEAGFELCEGKAGRAWGEQRRVGYDVVVGGFIE